MKHLGFKLAAIFVILVLLAAGTAAWAAESGEKWHLLISVHNLDSEFWAQEAAGAVLFAESRPDVEYTIQPSNGDDNTLLQGLKDFIAQHGKRSIAVFDPSSAANTVNIADICEEAGVYYSLTWHLAEGLRPEDYKYFVGLFSPDDEVSGYKTASHLLEAIGKKGNVVYLHGKIGEDSAARRYQGMKRALSECPDVKLVDYQVADWDQEKAMAITETWLATKGPIDGIIAANDTMALGAIEALKKAELNGKVPVTGTDGIQAAFDAIKGGDMLATIANDGYLLFGYAAAYAYAAATGQPHEKGAFYTNAVFVTKDNVEQVIADYIKGKPTFDFSDLKFPILSKREIK
ncbi:MAG: sugar ABC transporter substrate-binding protein [Synergistaceae bacterium]|jgi:ribose transport system substrate-binding protein|nr:sugar ABC transporter substrate-binding protein [Synergistaceae bacterium]